MVYLQRIDRRSERIGQLTVLDPDNSTVFEGNLRQCCHCSFVWIYRPGSGINRGFCHKCEDHICGKDVCFICYPAEQRDEDMERAARQLMTPGEWDARLRMEEFREEAWRYDKKKKRLEAAVAIERRREAIGVSV